MNNPPRPPVDILLVDDNPGKLMALQVALAPLGQNILTATSGEDALRLLMKQRFATIILDVNMPGMNGFQTAQMIRSRPSSAHTPIIFVSAVNLEGADALRGYALGAVDYIFAPVIPEILRAKVSVFVDLHRATAELERLNSEARTVLAAIVESSGDAIVGKTLEGVITSWNGGAARLFGYPPEEAIGRPILFIIPPELHDQEHMILERIGRGERIESFETVRVTKSGRRIDVSITVSPIRDASGRVIGASKVGRDITARKHAEQAIRDSEQRFRTLADASPALIWFDDTEGHCKFVNQRYVDFVGRPEAEIVGSGWQPLLHPEDGPAYIEEFLSAQREQRPFHARVRILRHDGKWRWIESHALPLFSGFGEYLGHVGASPDVTEAVEAEAALRHSEQRYRGLVHALPAAVYTCDRDGRITLYNRAAAELWGREPEVGKDQWCGSWRIYRTDGTLLPADECPMGITLREGRAVRGDEIIIERRDGTRRHVLPHPEPVFDNAGALTGAINMLVDITDLKHVQTELAAARDDLAQQVTDITKLHALSMSLAGSGGLEPSLERVIDAAMSLLGSDFGGIQIYDPRDSSLRLAAQTGFDPAFATRFARVDRDTPSACGLALRRGERVIIEDVRADPSCAGAREGLLAAGVLAVQSTPLVSRSGDILGVLSTHWRTPHRPTDRELRLLDLLTRQVADSMERQHAELALRESESRFRALADNIPQLAWMADGEGSVFWFNRRWFEYTGLTLEESRGWGWVSALHPDAAPAVTEKVRQSFRSGEPLDDTFLTRGADGVYRWFLCRAFPIRDEAGRVSRWFGTSTDVTEQREAQQILARDRETLERLVAERTSALERTNERLRVSERFASIGTLAAGLGHDMGNLLLPVRFHLEAIQSRPMPAEIQQDVSAVLRCTDYLHKLAHGLRMLALDDEDDRASTLHTDIDAWWSNIAPVLRGCLPRGAVLEDRIEARGANALIPEHQLSQAVFNIVQNAGDALRNRAQARVLIRAREDNGSVLLEITDNGPGMPEEIRRRCFEPFFTTKTRALSTGLGLSLVRTLITRAGGSVHVESKTGEGTTFILRLPRVDAHDDARRPGEAPGALVSVADPRIAGYITAVLQSFGYRPRSEGPPGDARLWVVDAAEARAGKPAAFCAGHPGRRAVVIGAAPQGPEPAAGPVSFTGTDTSPATIREALRKAMQEPIQEPKHEPADPNPVRGRQRADRRGDPAQAEARA